MARRDLDHLRQGLEERAPHVANRAVETIITAYRSLGDFPERGRPTPQDLRELIVPFGSAGYVIQYDVQPQCVIILRIFHAQEDR